jgi:predicted esterase
MDADVDERIYPRMGHTVNHDEIHAIQEILRPRQVHASQ